MLAKRRQTTKKENGIEISIPKLQYFDDNSSNYVAEDSIVGNTATEISCEEKSSGKISCTCNIKSTKKRTTDKISSSGTTSEDFNIEMYDSVEVDSAIYHKLIENAITVVLRKDDKDIPYKVIKTKTAYAYSDKSKTFTWLCTGFDFVKKEKNRNGEISVTLKTADNLGESSFTVPYSFFQKNALKELSKFGITISLGCETLTSMYFTRVIDKMKSVSAEQRLGFVGTGSDLKFYGYEEGILKKSMKFDSDKEYIEGLNELIEKSTSIQYLLSASMSAALMSVLNIVNSMDLRSYCLNVVGRSSTGKTISCKLCASMWSDPKDENVFSSMLSTKNALYKRLSGRMGLPYMFDEATVAADNDEFGYTIYEQREKHRLNPDCSERVSGTWNTVILLSSEMRIKSDHTKRDGGLVVRIHNSEDTEYTTDSNHADAIESFISRNYGVLGHRFVNLLIKNKDSLKDIYDRNVECLRSCMSDSMNNFTERLIKQYSLTITTAKLLKKLGLNIDIEEIITILCEQNSAIGHEHNIADNAINVIKNYLVAHSCADGFKLVYEEDGRTVKTAIITDSLVESILEKEGYANVRNTIQELDRNGYIIRQGVGSRNGRKSRLSINGITVSCYQLKIM